MKTVKMQAPNATALGPYLDARTKGIWQLIPLHAPAYVDEKGRKRGKSPKDPKWTKLNYSGFDAAAHMKVGGNVGVRLGKDQLVIDVDPRNFPLIDPNDPEGPRETLLTPGNPLERLYCDAKLDRSRMVVVRSGSGGLHIYLRKPADVAIKDSLPEYPGIEFKSFGRQVVSAGSVHPDTGLHYEWELTEDLELPSLANVEAAPSELMALIARPVSKSSGGSKAGKYDQHEVGEMLDYLNPEDYRDHDKWLAIMQSCHHASAGDAREEFVEWSTRDPEYADQAAIIGQRWDSLHADDPTRELVTYKTLLKAVNEAGGRVPGGADFSEEAGAPSAEEDRKAIESTQGPQEKKRIAAEKKQREENKELLANWVFIADSMQFIRRSDLKRFKIEQFNSMFGEHAKSIVQGNMNLSTHIFKEVTPCKKFESLSYSPGKNPELRPDGEGSTFNLWRSPGIEPRAPTPEECKMFEEHFAYLYPDPVDRGYLKDVCHFLVCHPGLKLNFATVIYGESGGTGKTWVTDMVALCLGERNVSRPNNEEIAGRFNAWQDAKQLAIIEEIYFAEKRKECMNKLKTVITALFIRIEDKGLPVYSIPNEMNLLASTNEANALPMVEDDRRWLVLMSPAKRMEEEEGKRYFGRLFGWRDKDPKDAAAAFMGWLMDHKPGLNPKAPAPLTLGKKVMAEMSMTDVEAQLKEAIESEAFPFKHDLFLFDDALASVRSNYKSNATVAAALQKFGCVKHGRSKNVQKGLDSVPPITLWSVRNHDAWEKAGPAGRARAYIEDMLGQTIQDFNERR